MRWLLLWVAALCGFAAPAQDLFDAAHTRQYAAYLLRTRQYEAALPELERLHFLTSGADTLQGLLLQTYRLAGLPEKGLARARQLYPDFRLMPVGVASEYGRLLIMTRQYAQAETLAAEHPALSADERLLLQIPLRMLDKRWADAEALTARLDATLQAQGRYRGLLQSARGIRYKSPGLAVALSAVLPGSGKVYTHDWKDGLISLLFVSASGALAYQGFHKRGSESVLGWIYSGVALGFYSGNLYGSYKAARRYNHLLDHKIFEQVEGTLYSD